MGRVGFNLIVKLVLLEILFYSLKRISVKDFRIMES